MNLKKMFCKHDIKWAENVYRGVTPHMFYGICPKCGTKFKKEGKNGKAVEIKSRIN